MKKIVMGVSGLLVMMTALVLIIPFFIDLNSYKPEILAKAKEVLGRDLDIEGKISLRLLPVPVLSADKIRMSNAPEGSQPHMVAVETVKIQVALWPLLQKKLKIDKIQLVGPDIFLERLPGGRGNWELSLVDGEKRSSSLESVTLVSTGSVTPAAASSSHNLSAFDLTLHSLEITDGRLVYKEGDAVYEVKNVSFDIRAPSFRKGFHTRGKFDYALQTVHVDMDLGAFEDPQAFRASFGLGSNQISLKGTLSVPDGICKAIVTGRGNGAELKQIAGLDFTVPPRLEKQLDFKADATASLTHIKLDNVSFKVDELVADGYFFAFLEKGVKARGRLKGRPGGLDFSFTLNQNKQDFAGSFMAGIQDLKSLLAFIEYDAAGIPETLPQELSLKTEFRVTPREIHLHHFEGDFKHAKMTGEMIWSRVALKPSFFVDLKTEKFAPLLSLLGVKAIDRGADASLKGKIEGDQKEFVFDTRARIGSSFVALKGEAKNFLRWTGFETKIDFKSTALVDLLKYFDIDLPQLFDQVTLTGQVAGDLAKVKLDTSTRIGDLVLQTRGMIGDLSHNPNFDLGISATHPHVKRLLGILGASAHAPSGHFSLSGHLGGTLAAFKLSEIKGTLGTAGAFSGSIDYSQPQGKPYVNTNLRFSGINLDHLLSFLKDSATVPTFPPIMLAAANAHGHASGSWSREVLDLKFLNYFDADVRLDSPKLIKKELVFDNPVLTARVRDGILKIMNLKASVYGGSFTLGGHTDAKNNNASQYTFSLKGAALENLSPKESSVKMTQGKIDIVGDLATSGNSLYALVSALSGKITLKARDGMISGFDLQKITANLGRQNRLEGIAHLLSTSFTKGKTPFSSLDGLIKIQNGIAHIKKLKLLAKGGEGTAQGTINLPDYSMNVKAKFLLTDLKNMPPVGVTFTGPLDNPVRSIDSAALRHYMSATALDMAKDVVGAIRSGKKKSADVIGAIIGNGIDNRQGAEQTDPSQSQARQTPDSSQQQPGIKDMTKGTEKAIKGLLKGLF